MEGCKWKKNSSSYSSVLLFFSCICIKLSIFLFSVGQTAKNTKILQKGDPFCHHPVQDTRWKKPYKSFKNTDFNNHLFSIFLGKVMMVRLSLCLVWTPTGKVLLIFCSQIMPTSPPRVKNPSEKDYLRQFKLLLHLTSDLTQFYKRFPSKLFGICSFRLFVSTRSWVM